MRKLTVGILTALVLTLAGCVSVPVQAMSNARQAVQAAQQAGAARYAPASYAEAERWLDDASFALKADDYGRARSSALKATHAARQAAAKARAAKAVAPSSAPVAATSNS
ncbi:MAG: DUF4398 domain-containing protein [Gammaproteobacteria bacterium]